MVIERTEGLETKNIKTAYGSSAGTAYVLWKMLKYLKNIH